MDPLTLPAMLDTWGYVLLLLLLMLTGVGSPVPEDALLFTTGYLLASNVYEWTPALAVSVAGVVVSDLMLYAAGRHLAWRCGSSEWRILTPRRLQRATQWFERVGEPAILIARLVPGTRVLVFVTAGVRGIPVSRFLGYDVLGAAVWVPLMLTVGHASGSRIGDLEMGVAWLARHSVWVAAAALMLLVLRLSWGREESKL